MRLVMAPIPGLLDIARLCSKEPNVRWSNDFNELAS